jgi:hypothetical protein
LSYSPVGPKPENYKRYWLLNFIEKNIEDIEMETVESYSFALAKLYKWLKIALEVRKEDIMRRREIKKKEREEREQALEAEKERQDKR